MNNKIYIFEIIYLLQSNFCEILISLTINISPINLFFFKNIYKL